MYTFIDLNILELLNFKSRAKELDKE